MSVRLARVADGFALLYRTEDPGGLPDHRVAEVASDGAGTALGSIAASSENAGPCSGDGRGRYAFVLAASGSAPPVVVVRTRGAVDEIRIPTLEPGWAATDCAWLDGRIAVVGRSPTGSSALELVDVVEARTAAHRDWDARALLIAPAGTALAVVAYETDPGGTALSWVHCD